MACAPLCTAHAHTRTQVHETRAFRSEMRESCAPESSSPDHSGAKHHTGTGNSKASFIATIRTLQRPSRWELMVISETVNAGTRASHTEKIAVPSKHEETTERQALLFTVTAKRTPGACRLQEQKNNISSEYGTK